MARALGFAGRPFRMIRKIVTTHYKFADISEIKDGRSTSAVRPHFMLSFALFGLILLALITHWNVPVYLYLYFSYQMLHYFSHTHILSHTSNIYMCTKSTFRSHRSLLIDWQTSVLSLAINVISAQSAYTKLPHNIFNPICIPHIGSRIYGTQNQESS